MKKIGILLLVLAVALLAFYSPAMAQLPPNVQIGASAKVVASFALSKISDITFGEMTANMTRVIGKGDMGAGKVLCAGVRDAPVAFWVSASGGTGAAGDVTSTITLSSSAELRLTLSSITVYDLNSDKSATGKPLNTNLDSAGNGGVEVGGTLNVPDATTAGTYIGSAYVFAEYD